MTTEPPRPDQIQANVAAALSRLRGELAPTPPTGSQQPPFVPIPNATAPNQTGRAADPILTSPEALFEIGPGLEAPDPSMALNQNGGSEGGAETPFARMTGLKPADQPDLLSGIGTTPPPLADLPDADAEAAHRRRRLRNRLLAGGVLVIALGAFWLLSGGDSGNQPVPVITADSAPEKVKPADEGGLEVPNQDVAILNGENSTAPTQGETVLPAPEQPATPPVVPEPAPAVAAPSPDATTATSDTGNVIPSVPAPAVDAIPAVPAPTEPTADASAAPAASTDTAPAASTDAAPAATSEAPAEPAAPATEAAPAQTASVQPAAGGSARVQLAAVKTEAAAQKEWARIQKAHPDVLGALTLHVEKFNKSANETFYRIQAGPLQDKASAKQVCAKLKQENQACIVAN